jgi:uncharacterized protein (DUF3820 family)
LFYLFIYLHIETNKTIFITLKTNKMDFILKFGKHKGQNFSSTPKSYQEWLLKQDWFKAPTYAKSPSQIISELSTSLKNWNGHSRNGASIYDRIFEAEKAEEALIFNNPNQWSTFYDGSW